MFISWVVLSINVFVSLWFVIDEFFEREIINYYVWVLIVFNSVIYFDVLMGSFIKILIVMVFLIECVWYLIEFVYFGYSVIFLVFNIDWLNVDDL